ncbi:MAG: pyrroline-5-carboxylate reductase [Anaerolineales bacterium]|nr:pyrroline-5-carboxylate reductase [Anaerolineales bacterium]
MLQDKKLTFIGGGTMAEAMLSGLLTQELIPAAQVTVTDLRADRLTFLEERYGVKTTTDNGAGVKTADIVVLAVKPQYMTAVARPLQGQLPPHTLLISILAGTTLSALISGFQHDVVVRAMPNTPAQIGMGMSMWTQTAAVSEAQKEQAQVVLSSFGKEIFTDQEKYLDMATAINGSGPGYVFLILEAMIDAGVHLGFARDVAETLVMQTVLGSVQYALASDSHLAELRNQVTSAGGTTAAGLYTMEKAGLRTALTDGIWAAYNRSAELGKPQKDD